MIQHGRLIIAVGCFGMLALISCKPATVPLMGTAESIVATASVDRATVLSGESVTFSVSVEYDDKLQPSVPEIGKDIAGMRVVDFGTEAKEESRGRKTLRKWYKLEADQSGSYVLPSVEIPYQDKEGKDQKLKTSEIFIEVQATKPGPESQEKDIHDIKDIQLYHWPWRMIAAALGVLGLLTGLGYWIWNRHLKYRGDRVTLFDPPHVTALKSLTELRGKIPQDAPSLRLFHFQLSETVRVYLEARFAVPATDRTLEEIRRMLPSCGDLDEMDRRTLLEILKASDDVKFAETWLDSQGNIALLDHATKFIGRTMPKTSTIEQEESTHSSVREESVV
jgi:BatD DUF11 like domain